MSTFTIEIIVAVSSLTLLLGTMIFFNRLINKEKMESKDFSNVMDWQTIALAVKSLVDTGELTITIKDGCYTATLRSQLGFKTRTDGFELHKVLKSLDHETTIKLIQLATKVTEEK